MGAVATAAPCGCGGHSLAPQPYLLTKLARAEASKGKAVVALLAEDIAQDGKRKALLR